MSKAPINKAAWLLSKPSYPFAVKAAPYTPSGPNQVVVRNAAVALNPVDGLKQRLGSFMFGWIKYPFIVGSDVAGEVVEVGKGVTHFSVGDRVLGLAQCVDKDVNNATEGAFQEYTVLRTELVSRIPDHLSYEKASVLPLALCTAASALFLKQNLALEYPSTSPTTKNGKTVLIWGGSTSVGCNAIQLAVAAGYDVVTTCSTKNFDLVKSLGASAAFDYRKDTTVKEIIQHLKGKDLAGAVAIAGIPQCTDIVAASNGSRKFVAQVGALSGKLPDSTFGLFRMFLGVGLAAVKSMVKSIFTGVKSNFVWGTDLKKGELAKVIFQDFLPAALEGKRYRAEPEAFVAGKGLESIQTALDLLMEGVSAKKVVVSL